MRLGHTKFIISFLFFRIILFIDHYEASSISQRTTRAHKPRASKSIGDPKRYQTQVILIAPWAGSAPSCGTIAGQTQHSRVKYP